MKNIKYIIRALVACIALGNLPMDAMRNQNKPQRRIPAPSGKTPTTKPGAEAAVNRLLAQDISKMNDAAFQAWQVQVLTYLQQMGLNRPATRTLFNRYADKVELQASQRAVDTVIAQEQQSTPSLPPISIGQSQGQQIPATQRPEQQPGIPVEQGQVPTVTGIMQLVNDLEQMGEAPEATPAVRAQLNEIKTALENDALTQAALIDALSNKYIAQKIANTTFLNTMKDDFKDDIPAEPVPLSEESIVNLLSAANGLFGLAQAEAFNDANKVKVIALAKLMLVEMYEHALNVLSISIKHADAILALRDRDLAKSIQAYNVALNFGKYVSNDDSSKSLFDTTMFITWQLDPSTAGNTQAAKDVTAYINTLKQIPQFVSRFPNDKDFKDLGVLYNTTAQQASSFMQQAYTFLSRVSTQLAKALKDASENATLATKAHDLKTINYVELALSPETQIPNFLQVLNNVSNINAQLSAIFAEKANLFPQQQAFYDLQAAMEKTYKDAQQAAKDIHKITE